MTSRTRLSREGRDTLWLLGVMSLIMALHAPRLPWWANLGAVLAVAWRAQLAWRDGPMPRRWLLLVGLAASMGLTVMTYHTLFGRDAGVTLVTLLASLKTLELRARRDAFVVTSLGFFLILTQFLYGQGPLVAFLMTLAFMGLLTSLVLAQRPLGRPSILSAIGMAGRSIVMGLPLMLALYVFFPRLGPLWSLPADAQRHTGLSDHIELGRIEALANDDSVAMRVKFEGAPPPKQELYFRGPVLDSFDGRTWSGQPAVRHRATVAVEEPLQARAPAGGLAPLPALRYQATIEPTRTDTVPLLDGTVSADTVPPSGEQQLFRQSLSWRMPAVNHERFQVQAEALRLFLAGDVDHAPPPVFSLHLPLGTNARTQAWALAWRHAQGLDHADGMTLTQALLGYIRSQNFRYSMGESDEPGQAARDPIDRFWLDKRVGFCEHFATSYVFILRLWGIPSRVVTGFQGAELNPVDGLYVVRNSDAHAWAEFWLAGQGWVRVDPTAAVAPDRIDRPRSAAALRQGLPATISAIDPALWTFLRNHMDAGNHRWNAWVLQYSKSRQLALLRSMGFESPDWIDLMRLSVAVVLTGGLAGLIWLWWSRPKQLRSPWTQPMRKVHATLTRLGLSSPAMPPPASALAWLAIIQQAPHLSAPVKAALSQTLRQLDELKYGAAQTSDHHLRQQARFLIQELDRLAKQVRKQTS
ncbi:MAG: hypothetical protein RI907_3758 [Pseudomonadota bacterium]